MSAADPLADRGAWLDAEIARLEHLRPPGVAGCVCGRCTGAVAECQAEIEELLTWDPDALGGRDVLDVETELV